VVLKLAFVFAFAVAVTVVAFAQAGGVARAPRLAVGAPPWPAPSDPMRLARRAGLKPELFEHLNYHVHSHLEIFINGKRITIPAGIGINTHDPGVHSGPLPGGSTAYGGIKRCEKPCISPLHTHADLGLLHTETSTPAANRLGQFFTEWGVRLDRRCVGGYCKPDSIRIYVNGRPYAKDPRDILLADHSEIDNSGWFPQGHVERVDLQVVHRPGCCG
jgi:hypothetical protein